MNRNILSLDFYGGAITAALAAQDDDTDTLRIRHILRRPCRAFSGAFVRDMQGAQEELGKVFAEVAEYVSFNPSVVVGLRGNFLSFKRESGFKSVESRNRIIGEREIEEATQNSIPSNLSDTLEVVDILPQSYTIDGNIGIKNPKGMSGFTLEVETFLSFAMVTHLNNLNGVLSACECNDYQVLPSSVAIGETLLSAEEKQAGVLLLDIGETMTSALLYHKGMLMNGWEIPLGTDCLVEAAAEQMQNDTETTRDILRTYEPGSDEIMDEVLEEAGNRLADKLTKELCQSFAFLKYPAARLVLCGSGANKIVLKSVKKVLGIRKARIGVFENLISDCAADNPAYCGALALIRHALDRESKQLGVAKAKEPGLLDGLLDKLGLSELF